jgi:hypothetical protein
MGKRRTERGQGLLELAVILPVLLILLIGLVEIGFALRDYLVVVNAGREGCRFAARERFTLSDVHDRVVSAGGTIRLHDPLRDVPFLRTSSIEGLDPNTGVIVTDISTDYSGEPLTVTVRFFGVFPDGTKPISSTQIINRHRPVTQDINAARTEEGYEEVGNHIVVVEVFFMHHPLWNNPFVPLPDPIMMHAQTEMRAVGDVLFTGSGGGP